MNIETTAWMTPNFVQLKMPARPRQEGFHVADGIPLKDVDEATLARMCDAFRAEVFSKACKADPANAALAATESALEDKSAIIDGLLRNSESLENALAVKDKEIERLTTNGVHTCHAECERPLCVADRQLRAKERQVRELEAYSEQIDERNSFLQSDNDDLRNIIKRIEPRITEASAALLEGANKYHSVNLGAAHSDLKKLLRSIAQHPAPPSPGTTS